MDAGQLTAAAQDVADMCGRPGGRLALKANHPTCVLQRSFGFAAGIFATSALDRPSLRSRGICRGCCDSAARRRATTGPRRAADVRPSPERRQLRATPGDVDRSPSTTVSGWLADTSSSRNVGRTRSGMTLRRRPRNLSISRVASSAQCTSSRNSRVGTADRTARNWRNSRRRLTWRRSR